VKLKQLLAFYLFILYTQCSGPSAPRIVTAGFFYFILYAVLGTFGPSRGETKATAGYLILFYFIRKSTT
jgi:hypothetical protein